MEEVKLEIGSILVLYVSEFIAFAFSTREKNGAILRIYTPIPQCLILRMQQQ